LKSYFEIVGGNDAESLAPKIKELVARGSVLHGIYWGEINATSSLSSSKWWDKAELMFRFGANVVAVVQSPQASAFTLHYIP